MKNSMRSMFGKRVATASRVASACKAMGGSVLRLCVLCVSVPSVF